MAYSSVSSIRLFQVGSGPRGGRISRPDLAWERPADRERSLLRLLEWLGATLMLAALFFALQPAGLALATYGAVGFTGLGSPLLVRTLRRYYEPAP